MRNHAPVIRSARQDDLEKCHAIDHSYQTSYVWQMTCSESDRLTNIRFQVVRLPLPLHVDYPHSPQQLLERWSQTDFFLVTEQGGDIGAYLTLIIGKNEPTAWVHDTAVLPQQRREGQGSCLLAAAMRLARQHKMKRLLVTLPMKNHPAISFYQKNGFAFCGYNEFFYESGDIALYFNTKL